MRRERGRRKAGLARAREPIQACSWRDPNRTEPPREGEPLPLYVPLSVPLPHALTLADAALVHDFVPVGATERLTVAQPLAEGLPLCVREARAEALPVPAPGKLVLVREEEGATEVVALTASDGLAARDAV